MCIYVYLYVCIYVSIFICLYIFLSHCTFTDFEFYQLEYDFNLASGRCHAWSRDHWLFWSNWVHILYKELFIVLGVHWLGLFYIYCLL